jgi:hypothetical protein
VSPTVARQNDSLMGPTVCILANTIGYPEGGGHAWAYLNWALGLREAGCRVLWLESVRPETPPAQAQARAAALKSRLARYGFDQSLILWSGDDTGQDAVEGYPGVEGHPGLEVAEGADLLLNFRYALHDSMLRRFRRTALVDIDPGLLQVWLSRGEIRVQRHDRYVTIGETVGQPGTLIPDVGLQWHHTPPPVSLAAWPVAEAAGDAPFSTVSHWYAQEWMMGADGSWYSNDKRSGFLPFLDMPRMTKQPLELALCLGDIGLERDELKARGWRIRDSVEVTSTPWDYQAYIQGARGEFSCVKPSCVKLQNAWISDRTICYLASGKPAVVQHTGPSRLLPDRAGLLRFRTPEEAVECVEEAAADYPRHSREARALAERLFDARQVATRVLEVALG